MPKLPKKRRAKRSAKSKPPTMKRKRISVQAERLVSMGIQASAVRHRYQELLEEVESGSNPPGVLLRCLDVVDKHCIEDAIVEAGKDHYPKLRWPKTVAPWRDDLQRVEATGAEDY